MMKDLLFRKVFFYAFAVFKMVFKSVSYLLQGCKAVLFRVLFLEDSGAPVTTH